MLIIGIATAPSGHVTHHLVRAASGVEAYRRLRPLLTPGSNLDTVSCEYWTLTRGPLPEDLIPLDRLTGRERLAIAWWRGRIITKAEARRRWAAYHEKLDSNPAVRK